MSAEKKGKKLKESVAGDEGMLGNVSIGMLAQTLKQSIYKTPAEEDLK